MKSHLWTDRPTDETERKTKAYALLWWKSNWANNCQFGLENYVKHSLKCDNIGSSKCLPMYRAVKILSTTCTFEYLSSIFLDYSHWSDWKAHKVLHLLNTNLNLRNVHKQVSKNFCGRWCFFCQLQSYQYKKELCSRSVEFMAIIKFYLHTKSNKYS